MIFKFLESRSHIAPKPTPRSFKPVSIDAITTKSVFDESTARNEMDDNESSSGDFTETNFGETKKFWQSLETCLIGDQNLIPVPKPRTRSQAHVNVKSAINKEENTLPYEDANLEDSNKLFSFEDNSIDQEPASIYNVKERENILDDDDEVELNNEKYAAFYIGESSGNLITKTATDNRSKFDNESTYSKDFEGIDQKPEEKYNISKGNVQHEVRFKSSSEEIDEYIPNEKALRTVIEINLDPTVSKKTIKEKSEILCDTDKFLVSDSDKRSLQNESFDEKMVEKEGSNNKKIKEEYTYDQEEANESNVEILQTEKYEKDHNQIKDETFDTTRVVHSSKELFNAERTVEKNNIEKSLIESERLECIIYNYDLSKDAQIDNSPIDNSNEQKANLEIKSSPNRTLEFCIRKQHEENKETQVNLNEDLLNKTKPKVDLSVQTPTLDIVKQEEVEEEKQKQLIDDTKTLSNVTSKNRWSTNDLDQSTPSSHSVDNSRPCSSDVENLYVSYPNSSGEYQTALDASSIIPGSTEYYTPASTFDNSGKTISSQDSIPSFDSESSGNFGNIELSEASETLVQSEMELESDNILDTENIFDLDSEENAGAMKRSHEMIFGNVQSLESQTCMEISETIDFKFKDEDLKTQYDSNSEKIKLAGSVGDGSNLSISFSTTSNTDTIIENIQDDMASSYGAGSLVGSLESRVISKTEVSIPDEQIFLPKTTSAFSEADIIFDNAQFTLNNEIMIETDEAAPRRGKGHKRNDSTSFLPGIEITKLSQESTDSSSLEEEMIVHNIPEDEREESGSDSDYDRYETEYSRSFKKPVMQRKKKAMTPKSSQKPEHEQIERKKSIPNIETIVEVSEDTFDAEKVRRGISQNMHDYSQIPDITITDDLTKYISDDEDFEQTEQKYAKDSVVQSKESKDIEKKEISKKSDTAREIISNEQYEKLIERQYKSQQDPFESKHDSADLSESFELLEQPDISDEFVIIEEVAKEADELMTEGKSVSIKQKTYVKKHDDEVEKIVIKSAPAATNEGSILLQGRHDLAFEFEESPSSGANTESSEEGTGIESSRKWVEMQLAEQAQNLRYPYDIDRGALEDIKEEDTEFEIGSSRISSFKDSYSSNDFEAATSRRYQTRDHDNVSINSLQEFERLEQAISLENKKYHSSSNDSFSNGSFPKRGLRTAKADEISLCSLQDFEGLENACLEATLLELKAKEEHALLLSRSDESNKSIKLEDCITKITENINQIANEIDSVVVATKLKSENDQEMSTSHLMEVSTDSLESKQIQKSLHNKNVSQYDSSDSLEISKSADLMTSSIDSIEISRDGAKTKHTTETTEPTSCLEKRDSVDSIDTQFTKTNQNLQIKRDSIDVIFDLSSSGALGGSYINENITVTTTSVASSGYGGYISKDISSDSLNIPEPELLITSTESLDNTSSTFATYQSQSDSQMTMSGSMTSCDSNTLVDSGDTPTNHRNASNPLADDTFAFGARMTSTSLTATRSKTSESNNK